MSRFEAFGGENSRRRFSGKKARLRFCFNRAERVMMGGGLTDLVPCRLSKEPDGNRSIPHCRWEKSSELERGGNSEVFFGV